jgi:hypothetical protein
MVDTIATARAADPTLKKCENRAKKKKKKNGVLCWCKDREEVKIMGFLC